MKLHLTPRLGYLAGFLICGGLILYALYLQYYEYQDPCPLCLLQRVVYIALMVVFLLGALHGPRRTGAIVYSTLLVLVSLIGAGIAGRHVWLQHLPKDKVPECGPGLGYILDRFPLVNALEKIFRGSGECAEAGWRLMGLSIAEWSLVWFVLLGAYAVFVAAAARKS
ncbi:MAG TPA: disulfide bond formation protein B [Burkholderiales bacterium]|jgi:disulfide bond formation protein DsbB|nr:disulfide bond formation protein B [Burkholderiales bacterium]